MKMIHLKNANYLLNKYNFQYSYSFISTLKKEFSNTDLGGDNLKSVSFHYSDLQTINNPVSHPIELAGSILEKESIIRNVRNHVSYSGKSSTKKNLFNALNNDFNFYHFSLHGLSDNQNRFRNKIYLKNKMGVDSMFGYEFKKFDLSNKFFILSSCNGSSGKIENSEGPHSLIKYILIAKAKGLIASNGKLDDTSTARIFDIFYNEKPLTMKTLRKAKSIYLKESLEQKCNPFYWSGLLQYI